MTASTSQSSDAQLFAGAETHKAAVCQIVTGKKSGTGCLIGRGLLITNSHVIPDREVAKSAEVFFLYDLSGSSYGAPFWVKLDPDTCFYTSPSSGADPFTASSLDFTVVALKGFKGHLQLEKIAKVALSILHDQDPKKEESILTIQHPAKRDEKTKLVGAQVFKKERVTELERFVIHYSGEKSGGGSGGAILNGDSKFVALHRGYCLKHKEANCKIGIRMQQILATLPKDVLALVRASQSSSLERAYLEDPDIKTLLATYIAPQGSYVRSCVDPFPLEEEVLKFLKSDKRVLLLQGGSGAGKTTFGKYLAYSLWKNRKAGDPLCLFIPPSMTTNTNRAVEQTLSDHGFSPDEIRRLKKEEHFVLIFDGYDEIGKKINLYKANRIGDWNAKVIISCRTQYLSGSYASLFTPLRNGVPQHALFQEFWVASFNDQQIDAYLQQYIKQSPNPIWTDYKVYRKYIDKIQGLKEMISVPFLLYVIAEVLPEIVKKHDATAPNRKLKLLKDDLYEAFVTQWFYRSEDRLRDLGQLPDIEGDIKELYFLKYCKKLAAKMFAENLSVVTYKPPGWGEIPGPWAEFFGSQDPMIPLLINAAPIQKIGNSYSFIHNSLLKYFGYREDFDQLIDETSTSEKEKRPVVSLPENFATKLLSSEPTVIQFYADAVEKYPEFKKLLFGMIELSKTDPTKATAAANSITILNVARIPFSRLDFREIRIPGANLYGAIFDGTRLDRANLQGAILKDAFLRDCSLTKTEMKEVWFGERAYLKHDDSVLCVAYSPDGKTLASGSKDHTVRLWDVGSGKQTSIIKGHKGMITSCTFLPDGNTLVTTSKDCTVRFWDVVSGIQISVFEDSLGDVFPSALSSDGKILASSSGRFDHSVRLREVASGNEISILGIHPIDVISCTFSPDGKILATGTGRLDSTIRLWSVDSGKLISIPEGLMGSIESCAFSPDGKTLAFGGGSTVRLWDVVFGNETSILRGHMGSVTFCTFSLDGKILASTSKDHTVRLWDVALKKEISILEGHTSDVTSCTFSLDGKTLASASKDNTVRLWDIALKKEIPTPKGHTSDVTSCTFSPDGKTLASASEDHTLRLWDVDSGKQISFFRYFFSTFYSCRFLPDGKTLAIAISDHTVRVLDVDSGKEILILKKDRVWSHAFSQDEKTLASTKTAQQWDLLLEKEIWIIESRKSNTGSVTFSTFSPDRKTRASTNKNHTVRVLDVASGRELSTLKGHTGGVRSCMFSPDGKTLASASEDHTVRLWDVASGRELSTLKGHTGGVRSCMFSPDGKTLATTSKDHTVRLWDLFDAKGRMDPRLVWSSSPLLFVEGANLEGTQISEANAQLLFQRGAISSKVDEKQKITTSHQKGDSPKRNCSIC